MTSKFSVMILCIFSLCFTGCGLMYIDPGNVGVKVNLYGSDKGVSEGDIVDPGNVWYNPYYTKYYEFPTYNQQAKWSKDNTVNESISFNSIEGSTVNCDVGLSYHFVREKIPHIFKKFRKDANEITHGFLRQRVQDAFNEHASTMKVTDIFGGKKHELLMNVTKDIREELLDEGFDVEAISFLGAFRVDPQVEATINQGIAASQQAIAAENKVRQIKAEADQAEEKAKGEAASILLKAKAESESNELLSKSITPELVQYQALLKWDGRLPQVSGTGTVPFINITPKTKE